MNTTARRDHALMRLCIVGKYPPIEGGVSTTTYWLARGLAERGSVVHIVTNAGEVENAYQMRLIGEDVDWLEPRFGTSGGQFMYTAQLLRVRPIPTLMYCLTPSGLSR